MNIEPLLRARGDPAAFSNSDCWRATRRVIGARSFRSRLDELLYAIRHDHPGAAWSLFGFSDYQHQSVDFRSPQHNPPSAQRPQNTVSPSQPL